jgi:glutamine---fructose-6-phosphate transaminase (isomerizing)
VHNGIITNFAKLKSFLEEEGEVFHTDTDTEVVAKLCSHLYASLDEQVPFPELVMMVLRKLEGAYAMLIQSIKYPGELVCCRKGSPVVLGLKDSAKASRRRYGRMRESQTKCFDDDTLECFIASDDKAIIEHTRVRFSSSRHIPPRLIAIDLQCLKREKIWSP